MQQPCNLEQPNPVFAHARDQFQFIAGRFFTPNRVYIIFLQSIMFRLGNNVRFLPNCGALHSSFFQWLCATYIDQRIWYIHSALLLFKLGALKEKFCVDGWLLHDKLFDLMDALCWASNFVKALKTWACGLSLCLLPDKIHLTKDSILALFVRGRRLRWSSFSLKKLIRAEDSLRNWFFRICCHRSRSLIF